MASRKTPVSAPLTFDLPESLIAKIETCRKGHGLKTASEVVRLAIEAFDFASCKFARDPHRQISVRVNSAQRALLKRCARQNDGSVGELIRVALESLPIKTAGTAKKKTAR
jgi:hypothetical protein